MPSTNRIEAELLRFAEVRGPEKTFCPSEVARRLWPDDWRAHMDDIRDKAAQLIAKGHLVCTQGGQVTDIAVAKGPIRLKAKV